MEKKLQIFMDSGLLDGYILGTTTPYENLEVESFIAEYPEVEAEYERLQNNLEILAKAHTVEAPKYILNAKPIGNPYYGSYVTRVLYAIENNA